MGTELPLKKSKAPSPLIAKDRFGYKQQQQATPAMVRRPVWSTQSNTRAAHPKAPSSSLFNNTTSAGSAKRSATTAKPSPSLTHNKKSAAASTSHTAPAAHSSRLNATPPPANKRARPSTPSSSSSSSQGNATSNPGSPLSSLSSGSAKACTPLLNPRMGPSNGVYKDRAAQFDFLQANLNHNTEHSTPITQDSTRPLGIKRIPLQAATQREGSMKRPKSSARTPSPPKKEDEHKIGTGETHVTLDLGSSHALFVAQNTMSGNDEMEKAHIAEMARMQAKLEQVEKEHACTTALLEEKDKANKSLTLQLTQASAHQTEAVKLCEVSGQASINEYMNNQRLLMEALELENNEEEGDASLRMALQDERARNAKLVRQNTELARQNNMQTTKTDKLSAVQGQLEAITTHNHKDLAHLQREAYFQRLEKEHDQFCHLVCKLKGEVRNKAEALGFLLRTHDIEAERARTLERECIELRKLVTGMYNEARRAMHTYSGRMDELWCKQRQRQMGPEAGGEGPTPSATDLTFSKLYHDLERCLSSVYGHPVFEADRANQRALALAANKLEYTSNPTAKVEGRFREGGVTNDGAALAEADLEQMIVCD